MLEKLPLAHSSHCAQPNPSEIDPGWQYWHGSSPCQASPSVMSALLPPLSALPPAYPRNFLPNDTGILTSSGICETS